MILNVKEVGCSNFNARLIPKLKHNKESSKENVLRVQCIKGLQGGESQVILKFGLWCGL